MTGATGNLGTALVRRLAGAGHDLVGVCRRPPVPMAPYDVATWTALDLAADRAEYTLTGTFAGAHAVVHLAWGFQPHEGDAADHGIHRSARTPSAADAPTASATHRDGHPCQARLARMPVHEQAVDRSGGRVGLAGSLHHRSSALRGQRNWSSTVVPFGVVWVCITSASCRATHNPIGSLEGEVGRQ